MTRAEAWEKFQAVHQNGQEELRQTFWEILRVKLDNLVQCIFDAFEEIAGQADKQEKEDNTYFLFSLQRCDLLEKKAVVRLDVMGMEWYLDENPLSVDFDITFLFQEYFNWQEQLLTDMRQYMGKVNKYDVSAFVQNEIMLGNQIIAHILRFTFRSLEQQESFKRIKKPPFWTVQWGEYRDYSETVVQVKRDTRGQEAWEDRLSQYDQNPAILTADYWYRENLTEGDCREKNMRFTVFEECRLKGIDFGKTDLWGTRFLRCRIEGCNFTGAHLQQTDFEDCELVENNFKDAELLQAAFSREGFEPEQFDDKQLAELLIVDRTEKEAAEE